MLGDKDDKSALALFDNYSNGVKTQRDVWAFNAGKAKLEANMNNMIGFYNAEVTRFNVAYPELDTKTAWFPAYIAPSLSNGCTSIVVSTRWFTRCHASFQA